MTVSENELNLVVESSRRESEMDTRVLPLDQYRSIVRPHVTINATVTAHAARYAFTIRAFCEGRFR